MPFPVPDAPEVMNDLAWLLTTASDEHLRDPKEAATLAAAAYKVTREREPIFLDTLAASQAASGQFEQALASQKRAVELASSPTGIFASAAKSIQS